MDAKDMEPTMTLTLNLPAETGRKLRACAAARGQDMASFALRAIQETLRATPLPTTDERLAPLREEFRESGMTEDELCELLKEARDEARRERGKRNSP
jgi:hypothetical protein